MGNFSGGNSLLHQSDFILEFQPSYNGDYILDNPKGKLTDGETRAIGKYAKVLFQKSIIEKSKKVLITYPVKYGRKPSGIWIEREIFDMLRMWNLATRKGEKGAWWNIDEVLLKELKEQGFEMDAQFQGENTVYEFLEKNPKIVDYLVTKFKKLLEMQPNQ